MSTMEKVLNSAMKTYMETSGGLFSSVEEVAEYAKSNSACMENIIALAALHAKGGKFDQKT